MNKPPKMIEWYSGDVLEYSTTIFTNETTMTETLMKELFDSEDYDTLHTLKISNIDEYKNFITRYSIRLNGVEIPNETHEGEN